MALSQKQIAARRSQKLAAIHVGQNQLGLDDETYRSMVERVSATVSESGKGVRSAAQLNERGLNAVLDELRRLGASQPTAQRPRGRSKPAHYPGKPHNYDDLPGEISKIEALLAELKLTWAYADGICKRMHGIDRVAWCNKRQQLVAIIAALHVEQEKRSLLAEIQAHCERLGLTIEQVETELKLVTGWQRQRRALKGAAAKLEERT